jgi:DNA-binding NarL/FixJ family response regulator
LQRLWVPTASRAPAIDRQNTGTGVREADITDVAAMFLPEELLPIVKGLSMGKSDVTVSRLLGVSPRTFSRKVAELLAYLEVATRFQAGAEVVHRWMLLANRAPLRRDWVDK